MFQVKESFCKRKTSHTEKEFPSLILDEMQKGFFAKLLLSSSMEASCWVLDMIDKSPKPFKRSK